MVINNSRRWTKPKALAAAILGACLIAFVIIDEEPSSYLPSSDDNDQALLRQQLSEGRRILDEINELEDDIAVPAALEDLVEGAVDEQVEEDTRTAGAADETETAESKTKTTTAIYPWARTNLKALTTLPEPENETVLFWHIPKSGGSTAKSLYRCLGKSIDVESQPKEILRAKEKGLVSSGKVDVIFSSFPDFAIRHLFDETHKGRVLAMFRHPVDRLISKFYYLQIATWERTYRPEWKEIDILEWVQNHNSDNDHYTKKLAGKIQRSTATEWDLRIAMRTIKQRFIVGLMNEMEESVHRFNVVLGVDEEEKRGKHCMNSFFGKKDDVGNKRNSNKHPKVEKDSEAWQLLAEKNSFDIRLFEYIEGLFEEQKEIVESYKKSLSSSSSSPSDVALKQE